MKSNKLISKIVDFAFGFCLFLFINKFSLTLDSIPYLVVWLIIYYLIISHRQALMWSLSIEQFSHVPNLYRSKVRNMVIKHFKIIFLFTLIFWSSTYIVSGHAVTVVQLQNSIGTPIIFYSLWYIIAVRGSFERGKIPHFLVNK